MKTNTFGQIIERVFVELGSWLKRVSPDLVDSEQGHWVRRYLGRVDWLHNSNRYGFRSLLRFATKQCVETSTEAAFWCAILRHELILPWTIFSSSYLAN